MGAGLITLVAGVVSQMVAGLFVNSVAGTHSPRMVAERLLVNGC